MKTLEVVAAVIRQDDSIFITQRSAGDFKDMWEFPGGKIEPGETPEQALKREIMEELDTQIEVDGFICSVEHRYSTFQVNLHFYLCHVVSGELKLLEHEAAKWIPLDDGVAKVDWLPADRYAITDIMAANGRFCPRNYCSDGILAWGVEVGRYVFEKERRIVYIVTDTPHVGASDVTVVHQISKEDYVKLKELSQPRGIPEPPVPASVTDACHRVLLCSQSAYIPPLYFSLKDVDLSLTEEF